MDHAVLQLRGKYQTWITQKSNTTQESYQQSALTSEFSSTAANTNWGSKDLSALAFLRSRCMRKYSLFLAL